MVKLTLWVISTILKDPILCVKELFPNSLSSLLKESSMKECVNLRYVANEDFC